MKGQLSEAKLRQLAVARQRAVESRRRKMLVRLQRDVEVTKLKLAVEQEGSVANAEGCVGDAVCRYDRHLILCHGCA
jgi:hypothetical protein